MGAIPVSEQTTTTSAKTTEAKTIAKQFLDACQRLGSKKVAMRKKALGIWQQYSWTDYYLNVKRLCLGMVSLGLERGDRVAIIGDNDPEWYWGAVACACAGGAVVGIETESSLAELRYILDHSGAVFVVAKDQEQVDKVQELARDLPRLRKVIYWDPEGLERYLDPILMSLKKVQELGGEQDSADPGLFDRLVGQGTGDEAYRIVYTQGTTGPPKAVILTHVAEMDRARAVAVGVGIRESDDHVSHLSLASGFGEAVGLVAQLEVGFTVNFPGSHVTAQRDIREISPHVLFYRASGWDSICSEVRSRIDSAGWLARLAFKLLLPAGERASDLKMQNKRIGPLLRAWRAVADVLLYRHMRDKAGLTRVRCAVSEGSTISPDVIRFFHGMGVRLRQTYATAEVGNITLHRPDDIRFDTVGVPLPGAEIRIGADREILVKAPWLTRYFRAPGVCEARIEDGFFHTGDAGAIGERGHLVYWDRLSDLVDLPGGEKYPPALIEARLRSSPYIRECMVFTSGRLFPSALIVIDFENVAKWAAKTGIIVTTVADLAQKREVNELVLSEISRANHALPEVARVRKYALLTRELDADEGELTSSGVVRRSGVEATWGGLLDAICRGDRSFAFETIRQSVSRQDEKVTRMIEITDVPGGGS